MRPAEIEIRRRTHDANGWGDLQVWVNRFALERAIKKTLAARKNGNTLPARITDQEREALLLLQSFLREP